MSQKSYEPSGTLLLPEFWEVTRRLKNKGTALEVLCERYADYEGKGDGYDGDTGEETHDRGTGEIGSSTEDS